MHYRAIDPFGFAQASSQSPLPIILHSAIALDRAAFCFLLKERYVDWTNRR